MRRGIHLAGGGRGDGCPGVLPVAGGEVSDGGGGRGGGGASRDRGHQGARRHLQAQPQQPRVRQPLPRHERDYTPLLPPRGQGTCSALSLSPPRISRRVDLIGLLGRVLPSGLSLGVFGCGMVWLL